MDSTRTAMNEIITEMEGEGMGNKKTALYCRVAHECEMAIMNQEMFLLRFASENSYSDCVVYRDNGFSGSNMDRPAMKALLEDMHNGRIGTLIVKDISRLGRNFLEVDPYITEVFQPMGVSFVSIVDGYDSSRDGDLFSSN